MKSVDNILKVFISTQFKGLANLYKNCGKQL